MDSWKGRAHATDRSYQSVTIGDAFEQVEDHVLLVLRDYGGALSPVVAAGASDLGQGSRASVMQLLVWYGKHGLPGRINRTRAAPCFGTVDQATD